MAETEADKQYFLATDDLSKAPNAVRIAIRINILFTFWMPTLAMAISDYYLGRIPNLFVVVFGIAIFVLFSKMYEESTRFGSNALLIHLFTFSTPLMFLFVSFINNWPLELVIAESVAVEMLALMLAMLALYIWINFKNPREQNSEKDQKKVSFFDKISFPLLILAGLVFFVLIIYYRFEGVIQFFASSIFNGTYIQIFYLIVPFIFVVSKYISICYKQVKDGAKAGKEINIISLEYGVPMLLNLLVPFAMYALLYYVPK
jgi:hypothetical protein